MPFYLIRRRASRNLKHEKSGTRQFSSDDAVHIYYNYPKEMFAQQMEAAPRLIKNARDLD